MSGSKKKSTLSTPEKRLLIEPNHPTLSIVEQCELLQLPRSSYYHEPAQESELNLKIMRMIDEQYMLEPSWGVPRMTAWVSKELKRPINRKRIERLMRLMGLRGIVPRRKKQTSIGEPENQTFPYLLQNLTIEQANQAWSSDITYIPMQRGFLYLVAIMDLHSRYVLSWELSNSMETRFCLDALEAALLLAKPDIFNSDKGSQYTSRVFIDRLLEEKIRPSMTGTGRCWDNIHIERLWWSVKYENVYLKDYPTGKELYHGLHDYFHRYNEIRPHQALDYKTPKEVYQT